MQIPLAFKLVIIGLGMFFLSFAIDLITNTPKVFALGFLGLVFFCLMAAIADDFHRPHHIRRE